MSRNDDASGHPPGSTGHLPVARGGGDVVPLPMSRSLVTSQEQHDEDEIDLLAYWHMLVRRRWLILGVVSAVLAVVLVWTLLTPPRYSASATLDIEPYGMQVLQVSGVTPVRGRYDPGFKKTQYELLQSRSLAERVAQDLNLAGSDIFTRLRPPGWLERVKALLSPEDVGKGADVGTGVPAGDTKATVPLNAATKEAQLGRAAGLIQGGLSIQPVRNSHLVKVQYTSTLPEFSAQVANAVAQGFIDASLDRSFGASSYAKQYLEDQLALTRSKLEESERKLVAYAQENNLVPGKNGSSLVEQNLQDLNQALAGAQKQRIEAEARWHQVKDSTGAALPSNMVKDSILPTLQERLAQFEAEYQDKLRTFKPKYPAMVALQAQITEVQDQVHKELARIRASVQAEYQAAVKQEELLQDQLDTLRARSHAVDTRSIQYQILQRDVQTNRELYEGLLQRFKQVSAAVGAKSRNIFVVDRAQVPGAPSSPNLKRNLMLGLLAGIFLAIMLVLLLEYLDNTLKTPEDVERHLHLGVLGIIPKLRKETPHEALEDPRSAFAESYRSVRTALQFSTDSGVPRTLLLTSPGAGAGKSTSAFALATNFAQLGKRVLLIEGDMRNPGLAGIVGLPEGYGLSSLLSGSASMAQVVRGTDQPGLDVILAGPVPPMPSELLASSKLVSLLTVAQRKYDQIIIDGPPVLGIADAPILGNAASGTLLVLHSGSTRIQAAQAAAKRLYMARAHMTGCLLTHYDARQSGYQYHYAGYYGYGYGGQPRLSAEYGSQ